MAGLIKPVVDWTNCVRIGAGYAVHRGQNYAYVARWRWEDGRLLSHDELRQVRADIRSGIATVVDAVPWMSESNCRVSYVVEL